MIFNCKIIIISKIKSASLYPMYCAAGAVRQNSSLNNDFAPSFSNGETSYCYSSLKKMKTISMARAEITFKIKGVSADKEVKLPKLPFLLSPSGPVGTNNSSETSFLKDHNSSYWILPIQQK